MMLRLPVLLGILLVITACGGATRSGGAGADDGDGAALSGKTFLSTRVSVDGAERTLAAGSRIRIGFTDDQISLQAGCNSMGGSIRVTAGRMTLAGDGLVMTEMACAEPLMAQDTWLAGLVTAGADLTQQEDRLTLVSGSTTIWLLDERTAIPDAPLWQTTWTLDSVIQDDTASSVPAGVTPTLRFEPGPPGKVRVQTGCNTGSGPVRAGDRAISFGPVATTRRGCVDPAAAGVERIILQLLSGETQFSINGRQLTLSLGPTSLIYRA